ncbi:protein-tyrosine-phosphatase [Gordonia spumicola]|uniref:Protein-tyrosine-phosphatase n=1 Tax=Gordonia spumicola TaxID=589161 RepID=A0A7I9VBM6_9ACTN|nr:tyrosine-protein phosphatase [Gordonia spumicola]GEE02551.1 protein-tyrosine-phosphatase [Gordonia spumicola]
MIDVNTSALRRRTVTIALSTSILAAPVAGTMLAPSASAAPGASPALSSTVLTPGREIGLAGTQNTRTLDGYRGLGGKHVDDLVLRSDNLSKITPADTRKLVKRRVTTVVDLRTDLEKRFQPNRPVPGARTVNADVLGGVSPVSLVDLNQAYAQFVTNEQARTEVRRTLLAIKSTAARGETTLYHCSAGKDRTGWVTATLLTILGVDRATINADYLASNRFRHASPNDFLNGVNLGLLNTSFAAAKRRYGSMDGYIRKGLRLTTADINSLRASLLR